MEMRVLGRTGEKISAFGFGGIVVMNEQQDNADKYVAQAIEEGINYFDVAPSYGDAQYKLGTALKQYRKHVVLACKTAVRDAKGARNELENSLKALKTDYFDVYQLHGIDDPEQIDQALAPGGALEAVLDARQKGLVRFVGFSCHHENAALSLLEKFDFDTVLFPFNWTYWLAKGIGPNLIGEAKKRNMGIIAMKALAHRSWLENEEHTYPNCWYKPIFDNEKLASMALRFTLSLPVDVALSPGDVRMLRIGLKAVGSLENAGAISSDEIEELTRIAGKNSQFMW